MDRLLRYFIRYHYSNLLHYLVKKNYSTMNKYMNKLRRRVLPFSRIIPWSQFYSSPSTDTVSLPLKTEFISPEFLPGRGRGLCAAKRIESGTLIHHEWPLSMLPDPRNENLCDTCLALTTTFNTSCEKCKVVYCSEKCKAEGFQKVHRLLCGIDFSELASYCTKSNLRFPLKAADRNALKP